MRIAQYKQTQRNINEFSDRYNWILKKRKTRKQWIVRSIAVVLVLSFLTGVFSNLTGLNFSNVVSARESTTKFNPVKREKIIVIVVSSHKEAQELLAKFGGENETRIEN